jgi:hypothetical protein
MHSYCELKTLPWYSIFGPFPIDDFLGTTAPGPAPSWDNLSPGLLNLVIRGSSLRRMPTLSKTSKSVLFLLALLAGSELVLRGPVRFLKALDFNDFISPYLQSRALIHGLDPYSPEVLVRSWPSSAQPPEFLARDLADGTLVIRRGIPTAYPLTCLVLLAPLAILPWPAAAYAWLAINGCLVFAVIPVLFKTIGFQPSDWRGYLFIIFSLALAPLHTGLATGSIAISTVALCGIAWSTNLRGQEWMAGFFFGLAICLKPQIGLPFLACYLLRRRWRLSAAVAMVVLASGALAIAWLAFHGTGWIQNYETDNRTLLSSGILSDFTERNPIRFGLVNLQVLSYAVLNDARSANALALGIGAVLFGIWVLLAWRNQSGDLLLSSAAIAVISLLPVYHRFYDAFLLIFPIAWALREFGRGRGLAARWALVLTIPFLVPGGTALERLQASAVVSPVISHSWYWGCMVMPHQVWCLLFLSMLLLGEMAVKDAQTSCRPPTTG